MQVRAIRPGYFKSYREVGDIFEIPDHLFSQNWHEEVAQDGKGLSIVSVDESLAKRAEDREGRAEYKAKQIPGGILAQIAGMSEEDKAALRELLAPSAAEAPTRKGRGKPAEVDA
jgi:3-mercaptopyruvate sulfurtransferase SseA